MHGKKQIAVILSGMLFVILASLAGAAEMNDEKVRLRPYAYLDAGPAVRQRRGSAVWSIDSRGSFVGLEGKHQSTGLPSIVFQLEYEVSLDGGSPEIFTQNDSYIGIEGRAGRLLFGTLETPLRHLADPIDLFADSRGDLSELWSGDTQEDNSIYYQSSSIGNMRAELAVILAEEEGVDTGVSAALLYEGEAGGAALASNQDVGIEQFIVHRATLHRIWGALSFGAALEYAKLEHQRSTMTKVASVLYRRQAYALKFQFGETDAPHSQEMMLSVGCEYELNENMRSYGYFTEHRLSALDDDYSAEFGLKIGF